MDIRRFLTNKIALLAALLLLVAMLPAIHIKADLDRTYEQISLLQKDLARHKADLNTVATQHTSTLLNAWQGIRRIASPYKKVQVTAVEAPVKLSHQESLWWGKAQGDLLEVLLFARKADQSPYTQLHSFSYKADQASLLFYLLAGTR